MNPGHLSQICPSGNGTIDAPLISYLFKKGVHNFNMHALEKENLKWIL